MSLLLDALNKADQERKRNETTPGISSNHEQRVDEEESRGYSLVLIVAGVIGLGLLLVAIYWLGQRSTATNLPATANSNTSAVTATTNNKKSVATNSANTGNSTEQQTAPANNPAPETEENVANLYQQNNQVPESNASITLSAPPPVAEPGPVTPENIESPTSIAQFANLPELHALPNNILERVPTITYTEHNYNVNGSTVKINGSIFQVNEQIANGIVIDKILEDGLILHIDNYSFKMRAMNSWINM